MLDFYASPGARALLKRHFAALVTRVNSLTGLAYNDDPAVLGFNIMNEPRCPGCTTAAQQRIHLDWIADMASFLKALAPRQLVSAATEVGCFFVYCCV